MVTRSEKFVLLVLADSHQDRADRRTFPKVATIAQDAMMCERQCQRAFASLERKGVLRREYPAGTGRDRLTYYFFLELDGEHSPGPAVKKPVGKAVEKPWKGDKMSPLFPEEGRHKGDIRVTSDAPLLIAFNKSNEDKSKDSPLPPATTPTGKDRPPGTPDRGGVEDRKRQKLAEVERGVDQVCSALGISNPRKRKVIGRAIAMEAEKGEFPPTTALAMIAALQRKAEESHLLRPCSLSTFLGDGIWRDERRWFWDKDVLREERKLRDARVGMG